MIKAFTEGDVFRHPSLDKDVMVLGIGKETATEVVLAVLWVEREGDESTSGGELTVQKSKLGEWEQVQ